MHLFAWSYNLKGSKSVIGSKSLESYFCPITASKPMAIVVCYALHPTKNAMRRYNLTHYSVSGIQDLEQGHAPWHGTFYFFQIFKEHRNRQDRMI